MPRSEFTRGTIIVSRTFPVATTHTKLMTFAEFAQLPEAQTCRHELRHGELVTVAPPIQEHSRAQWQLRRMLEKPAGERGVVKEEFSFRALPEYEYRVADVAYLSKERWENINPKGLLAGVPELVIEVLSPSNTVAEIFDKRTLCLENGAREFWTVDIDHRQVEVSTPDGHGTTYKSGQHVPLFFAANAQLAVDSIFA
jgi:Uma2 family endonuclease